MGSVLGFEPTFSTRAAFEDFAASVGPPVPGAGVFTDVVGGLAGTATQTVLRTLGAGKER